MCGICGIFNYSSTNLEINEALITSMRDTMVHRGPDDAGIYVSADRKAGLGFRRLSIIDLSAKANQPMANEDNSIWIVFNGEIYNHLEIRKFLESKGHIYRSSHSDTETIIHLYEEKGPACVKDIEGMFAFAIWDSRKRLMFLARDRMGKKPLYYTLCNGQLIFASEIKSILKTPGITRELDTTALYHYLTLWMTPAPLTLFKGINKLPSGYYMICGEDGHILQTQYWDAIVPDKIQVQPEEYYVSEIRRLLTRSIKKRMMSDVPFGVFLSGGVDSSTNVAIMTQLMDRPVDTFTVGFKDQPEYTEFQYARQIAREFNTNHHEIVIDQNDVMEYIPKLVFYQDEPLADWSCVPLHFVSKLARDNGTIVVQIGEGSDELFFGYNGYASYLNVYNYFWKPYMKLPDAWRRFAYWLMSPLSPFIGKGPGIKEILRCAAQNEELFWSVSIAFTEAQKKRLMLGAGTWQGLNTFGVVKKVLERIDDLQPDADFVQRMIYLELKHRLPELLLMRVDKITMSTSVEGRAPFLDQDLVELALRIPSTLKYRKGQKKYILKKAVEGIIPDNIIYRKKQGFVVPVKEWFKGELGTYMSDAIMNSKIRERQFFDYDFIGSMIKQQRESHADNIFRLWTLFNLSKWYDFWM
ncbi:MAG: asparagine synthase (glutamine-hydrolyzing) [Dehalococcoidia bacterium]